MKPWIVLSFLFASNQFFFHFCIEFVPRDFYTFTTHDYIGVVCKQYDKYTLGKKGCYTPGWCVFFVIISISSVREV